MTQDSTFAAKRFIVRGRVQGVGFRWFVEREANQLGLAGWVRNNEDSTVECLAAGPEEKVRKLKARLEEGPRASRVDRVDEFEVGPEDTTGALKTFEIRGAW
jgi:acylphosphatase